MSDERRVYDRDVTLRFIATYANASCSRPSVLGYLDCLADLSNIPDEALPKTLGHLFDRAQLSPYQRVLVEDRYGLRGGKDSIGSKMDADVMAAVQKLDHWALTERVGRRVA